MYKMNLARAMALAVGLAFFSASLFAQTRLTLGTNWYAEAEHGGYYQALAEGTYKKYGLDVQIKMGGPQVNVLQLLLAGQFDIAMSDDFQTLKAVESGLPLLTLAATFQRDPVSLIAHPGVVKLEDLTSKTVFIGQASESTYWPWLKAKYNFSDERKKRYTFSVQPFLADPNSATQGYVTSEPFSIEATAHFKPVVFLLGHYGYPPYGQTIVVARPTLEKNADVYRRFLQASAEGWKSYLTNPAPGNALILRDNPQINEALLAYGVQTIKEYELVTGGDAKRKGIMTISDSRWEKIRDFMVDAKLIGKNVDYKKAYTTTLIDQVKVLP